MSPTRRILTLVLGVGALAASISLLPLSSIPATVTSMGLAAPVVGVAVGAVLLIALMPRTPVSMACGLLFGAATGIVCALLIALVAAAITFTAGRLLGRDFITRHAGRRWQRLEEWINREGVLAVAAVRALPIGPYGLAGYAYGGSGIRVRDYVLGTLISASPSAVTYALLGASVARPGDVDPLTAIPLVFGFLLSAAIVIRARRRSARAAPVDLLTGDEITPRDLIDLAGTGPAQRPGTGGDSGRG